MYCNNEEKRVYIFYSRLAAFNIEAERRGGRCQRIPRVTSLFITISQGSVYYPASLLMSSFDEPILSKCCPMSLLNVSRLT